MLNSANGGFSTSSAFLNGPCCAQSHLLGRVLKRAAGQLSRMINQGIAV